jgi:phosphoglucosamine mutase
MRAQKEKLAELVTHMRLYPQVMVNVTVARRIDPKTLPAVTAAVAAAEARLADGGRVVLRASGTEALIRVMVEGRDEAVVRIEAESLAAVVRAAAGA